MVNLVYLAIFMSIYIWRFSLAAALLTGLLVLVIKTVWSSAMQKDQQKHKRASTYAEISRDSYRKYESHMNELLGIASKPPLLKENAKTGVDARRESFARVYLSCNKQLIDTFKNLGLSDDELADDKDIQEGLLILHSTIIVISQAAIKGKARESIAAELLRYFESMIVKDFSINLSELREAVAKAHRAYTATLRHFVNGAPGNDVPILAAVKTIKPLATFYAERGQLNMMLQLPSAEQAILSSYQQYWDTHL
jgi:hypothetical protein